MTSTYNDEVDKINDYLYQTTSRDIRLYIMDTIDSVRNGSTPVLQSDDALAKAAFFQQSMGNGMGNLSMEGWEIKRHVQRSMLRR